MGMQVPKMVAILADQACDCHLRLIRGIRNIRASHKILARKHLVETIYSTVTIYWREYGTDYCGTWNGVTVAQASQRAALWGCKFPKWWQFWLNKPVIVTSV
jgi:hypothetical protein